MEWVDQAGPRSPSSHLPVYMHQLDGIGHVRGGRELGSHGMHAHIERVWCGEPSPKRWIIHQVVRRIAYYRYVRVLLFFSWSPAVDLGIKSHSPLFLCVRCTGSAGGAGGGSRSRVCAAAARSVSGLWCVGCMSIKSVVGGPPSLDIPFSIPPTPTTHNHNHETQAIPSPSAPPCQAINQRPARPVVGLKKTPPRLQ